MKNVYFLSDAHLGSRAIPHGRTQERRLVNFLDSIKHKAAAVYLLGDMFDFWYEFRTVVPKGYTRFLGKLSELTDMGVDVHFFTGNMTFGVAITLPRSAVSCCIVNRLLWKSMARSFILPMAMGWATRTRNSNCCARCSTAGRSKRFSPPFIPDGAWISGWRGRSIAA